MNDKFLKTIGQCDGHDGKLITKPVSRRTFIKKSAVLGASTILAGATGWMPKLTLAAPNPEIAPDIAAVKGANYYQSTLKALEMLGGIGKFVSKQSRVGLLINANQDNPGSYVKPEITLAVIHMCLDAGAKAVGVFKSLSNAYWRRGNLSEKYRDEVKGIQYIGGNHKRVTIKNGRSLKEAEVAKALLECDVFINMPIAKDHTGVRFTGTMKNMMGISPYSTNGFFHHGSGASGYYDDIDFLSQCIADLNLVRQPDLCIFDGTEVITTNGPGGPGKLIKPQTVFAGVDRVAVDVYGANLIGLRGQDILTAQKAYAHGLGKLSLSSLQIQEVTL